MKILVIGKNGQLGKSLKKTITNNKVNDNYFFIGKDDLDLRNSNSIRNYFEDKNFDLIVNCAAYTMVDKAEEESESANQINHIAVAEISKIALKKKSKLIHISTDYVFDGRSNSPYKESDLVNPINNYGFSKLKGEEAVLRIMPKSAIIIRTSWLYSEFGVNFVRTMLKLGKKNKELKVINDQIGSPTYAMNLARAIIEIIQSNFSYKKYNTEIYHFSDAGECSWYEFAEEIFRLENLKCKLIPVLSSQYVLIAKRPRNSVMETMKISRNFKVYPVNWKSSLQEMLIRNAIFNK
jgi:dTDP-4-dehydrorhamnose reductase